MITDNSDGSDRDLPITTDEPWVFSDVVFDFAHWIGVACWWVICFAGLGLIAGLFFR